MSNFLAIATVTATLNKMLLTGVQSNVPGVTISMGRPDTTKSGTIPPTINLFLYQVTPNAALRNMDLPERSTNGQLTQRPRAALDLHYILSFLGDEGKLEPQRLLGSAVRVINSQPLLTRDRITTTIGDPTFSYLAASNLAEAVELVRFTPAAITLDEMSKIWSIFYQMPYALSVVYTASMVFIEGTETFPSAPPVQKYLTYTIPSLGPTIDQVLSQTAINQPVDPDQYILPGYRLVLRGTRLRGEITRVSIGGVVVTPPAGAVSNKEINVPLPGGLQPGVQAVQVIQPFLLGDPAVEHRGLESNVVPVLLHPQITAIPTITKTRTVNGVVFKDGSMRVNFTPRIGLRQYVVLELNQFNTPANTTTRGYTFTSKLPHKPNPSGATDTNTLDIPFTDVAAGAYLVRVKVDGAESPLGRDAQGVYNAPQVNI